MSVFRRSINAVNCWPYLVYLVGSTLSGSSTLPAEICYLLSWYLVTHLAVELV